MKLQEKRAHMRAEIPAWYNGYVHFFGMISTASLIVAICVALLNDVQWWQWLFIPAFFVFANAFEWAYHKGPLHHPVPRFKDSYKSHATRHHVLFTDDDMELQSHRDLIHVLFHPKAIGVFLAVDTIPALLGWLIGGWNVFLIAYISGMAYYIVYETLHTLHHFPMQRVFGRESKAVAFLRTHHQRHHNLRKMTHGNFNVSFPLWDYLVGSVLPAKQPGETPNQPDLPKDGQSGVRRW